MITLVKDTIDKHDIDRLIDWLKTYPRLTKGEYNLKFEEKFARLKKFEKFEKLTPAACVCPPHSSRSCWQRPAPNAFALYHLATIQLC